MKSIFLCVLFCILGITLVFGGAMITDTGGSYFDGGRILVSSYGVTPSGGTTFSSTRCALGSNDFDDVTYIYWGVRPEGFDVWIDSYANVQTSGANEGYKIKQNSTENFTYCPDKTYMRTLAGQAGHATVYFKLTGDREIQSK